MVDKGTMSEFQLPSLHTTSAAYRQLEECTDVLAKVVERERSFGKRRVLW